MTEKKESCGTKLKNILCMAIPASIAFVVPVILVDMGCTISALLFILVSLGLINAYVSFNKKQNILLDKVLFFVLFMLCLALISAKWDMKWSDVSSGLSPLEALIDFKQAFIFGVCGIWLAFIISAFVERMNKNKP